MKNAVEAIALFCLAWVGYVYVLYPVLLALWGFIYRFTPNNTEHTEPSVSVLISARNEVNDIGWKVRETLSWDYSAHKLEVLVASDASDDGTDDVLHSIGDPRLKVARMETRVGKTAALNRLARIASGEILFFTDANSHIDSDCLRLMIRHFRDPRVGCVTGTEKTITGTDTPAMAIGGGSYLGYESFLNALESRLGSVLVCDGSIYCIRRELFGTLDPDLANDLEHPIRIGAERYKILFENAARSSERTTSSLQQEFARRRRIAGQGALGLWRMHSLITGMRLWQFISRKLMRWLSLIPLAVLLTATVYLHHSQIWNAILIAQIAFYLLAALGWATSSRSKSSALLSMPFYFLFVHLGALLGVLETCFGRRFRSWEIATLSRGADPDAQAGSTCK